MEQRTNFSTKGQKIGEGVPPPEMPFHHFRQAYNGPNKPPKFKSQRKRASKLFAEINEEAVRKSKEANPNVHDVHFRVGDAIEMEMIAQGGVTRDKDGGNDNKDINKIRGVVLGIVKRGLGSGVYLRDVVFGEPVDRKIPLHSPMIQSIKVLEKNFVFKGKRKIKRAKLYYLRDRMPQETRVTKW